MPSPFQPLRARLEGLPAPVRAAAWMVLGGFSFTIVAICLRYATTDVHPFEVAFFRNAFGLFIIAPVLLRRGLGTLRTRRLGTHALRATTSVLATLCWFSGFASMPIADMTALTFTAPLFATAGAALFLGEGVGARRWLGVAVGFAGAVIILRPGVTVVSPLSMVMLAGAAFVAAGVLLVKSLSRTESPVTIVSMQILLMTPISLIPAAFFWRLPALETVPWLIGVAACATFYQFALARALSIADAASVMPFEFAKLLFAAALGFVLFHEFPDAWTWIGGLVIFSAVILTTRSETRRGKHA